MTNIVTERIKSASTWFIKVGAPGQVDEYPNKVKELASSIPIFAKILNESTPTNLIDNLKTSLGLRKSTELGMLVTGIGGTPLQLLNLYLNHLGETPINLSATINVRGAEFTLERNLQRFGNASFRQITHKNIETIEEVILEDALFVICFAYATDKLGHFLTWRKCNLASYCGQPENENLKRLTMALIWSHSQIQGTENVNTGKLAEQKIRTTINQIVVESDNWASVLRKVPWKNKKSEQSSKSFDLALKIESPNWDFDTPKPEPQYIAIEIAWQETGNSVIHRKASEYEDVFQIAKELGHWYCVVVDGVGYFSRSQAIDTIISNAHCAVGLSDTEIEILKLFITEKIKEYQTGIR